MSIAGTTTVRCACGKSSEVKLVQSINAKTEAALEAQLLDGSMNLLTCTCGRRTRLEATLVFHDPDRTYFCQACPGGDDAMQKGADAFLAAGPVGTCRLVPSFNALVEKVKILRAGFEDWAIEMTKILLLASIGELDRVLLFDRIDGDVIRWILFDEEGRTPEAVSSPRAAYDRIAANRPAPAVGELRIDRAWATDAVRRMIESQN